MSEGYDVIVIGLGGMGSATAYQLARRGKHVLGLERHTPAHDRGSSHGESRIIRQAYFEDPAYVPLLLRAYELWEQIERETGEDLLTLTGGLMMGGPDSRVVTGSLRSAREHGLAHEVLDAAEIRRRYPPLQPAADEIALFEGKAGYVRPEMSVAAHLKQALVLGADLRFEEPVTSWEASPSGDGVTVTTDRGTYRAERLVVSPGPWAPQILADIGVPLEIERQVLYWFAPTGGIEPYRPSCFPIYIWDIGDNIQFYGFPAYGGPEEGAKVAFFRAPGPHNVCTPETIDRTVHPEEVEVMRAAIAERMPTLNGDFLYAKTCMYTNTPDEHFLIALHPTYPQVAVAAGFSGHGFKFASVVGEIMADLAIEGKTRYPIALFKPERFARA
ncbi:MAG: N-methyl-L-tryptophan oxidase [Anaerolineae bacterium]